MSPAPSMDFRLNEQPLVEYKLFAIWEDANVTHHLRFNHSSSCVTLNGSDVQQFAARIVTILESGFVASFPHVIDPISVSELMASIPSERKSELRKCQFPMNLLHLFLCLGIFMSYKVTDNFRDLRFPLVSVAELIGNDVFPFPFMVGNVIV